jgi:CRISPR/Cas system CSM-associated protein Csm3 (group 7 of RAMP superfamily)
MSTYRISGNFKLRNNLHIGAGDGANENGNLSEIAKGVGGLPYIPGSSLKGALSAFAKNEGFSENTVGLLFGTSENNTTRPGAVEFCNAYSDASSVPEKSFHSVRNRHTGAVEEHLFFEQEYLPAGSTLKFEFTVQKDRDQMKTQALLELLKCAGVADSEFSLGSGSALSMGKIALVDWKVERLLTPAELWETVEASIDSNEINKWATVKLAALVNPAKNTGAKKLVLKNQVLNFTSPFMSYVKNEKTEGAAQGSEPDGKSRRNQKKEFILPASSFHGALRSQAERILRTVGLPAATPTELPIVRSASDALTLDLAALLFGAPGWKSVVELSDFVAPENSAILAHDMIAIDRITGAGKDGAKFKLEVLDCPRMTGNITVDLKRLKKIAPDNVNRALGLLAHTLRDLDEGDIALGYGEAKGYGISNSGIVKSLITEFLVHKLQLNDCLKAFAEEIIPEVKTTTMPIVTFPTDVTPAAPGHVPVKAKNATDRFHNPYAFIPFPSNQASHLDLFRPKIGELAQGETDIGHAKYAAKRFHGRIVCTLKCMTPIFIGGKHTASVGGAASTSKNFMCKRSSVGNAEIAIPATSLRGLISSIHEPLTNSGMRVVANQTYSMRADTDPLTEKLIKQGIVCQVPNPKNPLKTVWGVTCTKGEPSEIDKSYPIDAFAHKRLETLAKERHDKASGELTFDYPRWRKKFKGVEYKWPAGTDPKLATGQFVFFALDSRSTKVTALAWSQLWRTRVELKQEKKAVETPMFHKTALTLQDELSATESLFGTVRGSDSRKSEVLNAPNGHDTLAFASRVRFTFAHLESTQAAVLAPAVVLKSLLSPKPPAPAFYFRPRHGDDKYVSKADLAAKPTEYAFKGRKQYLHALRNGDDVAPLNHLGIASTDAIGARPPWESHPNHRPADRFKILVTPVERNTVFNFSLDFKNLTQAELESICAALSPTNEFEHKIGMGKPIGLDSIKIEVSKIEVSNRQTRYAVNAFDPTISKFSPLTSGDALSHTLLAQRLAREHLRRLEAHEPSVYAALVLLGNPKNTTLPVHYPQIARCPVEIDSFKWFVDNDGKGKDYEKPSQHLESITAKTMTLPSLSRIQRVKN